MRRNHPRLEALARQLGSACATLALLATLIFALAHAMPGGPAYAILGLKARPNAVAAVDLQLGLDVPLWRQFAVWWLHLLQGDFGNSYLQNQPVGRLLSIYAGPSVMLCGAGIAVAAMLAFAAGAAMAGQGRGAALLRQLVAACYALPGYFVGSMALLLFAIWLPVLPGGGIADQHQLAPSATDDLRHLTLPALVLAFLIFPAPAQIFAQALAEEQARPYARAASARGLGQARILWHHLARNAYAPVLRWFGANLPAIISGAVVVETVFDYPGLGWLLWRSALNHDYPVLSAEVLLFGLIAILANTLIDAALSASTPAPQAHARK